MALPFATRLGLAALAVSACGALARAQANPARQPADGPPSPTSGEQRGTVGAPPAAPRSSLDYVLSVPTRIILQPNGKFMVETRDVPRVARPEAQSTLPATVTLFTKDADGSLRAGYFPGPVSGKTAQGQHSFPTGVWLDGFGFWQVWTGPAAEPAPEGGVQAPEVLQLQIYYSEDSQRTAGIRPTPQTVLTEKPTRVEVRWPAGDVFVVTEKVQRDTLEHLSPSLPTEVPVVTIDAEGHETDGFVVRTWIPRVDKPWYVFLDGAGSFRVKCNSFSISIDAEVRPHTTFVEPQSDRVPVILDLGPPRKSVQNGPTGGGLEYTWDAGSVGGQQFANDCSGAVGRTHDLLAKLLATDLLTQQIVIKIAAAQPGALPVYAATSRHTQEYEYQTVRDALIQGVLAEPSDQAERDLIAALPLPVNARAQFDSGAEAIATVEVPSYLGQELFGVPVGPEDQSSIRFVYSRNWVMDSRFGVPPRKLDLELVLLHESIHALGFWCKIHQNDLASASSGPLTMLDLFRVSSANGEVTIPDGFRDADRMLVTGNEAYLVTAHRQTRMCTGFADYHDGVGLVSAQGEHWKETEALGWLGVMEPRYLLGEGPRACNYLSHADVEAIDAIGWAVNPDEFFDVGPAAFPALPENGQVDVPHNHVVLEWDSNGYATSYSVRVFAGSEINDDTVVFAADDVVDGSIEIPAGTLLGLSQYTWLVTAFNDTGWMPSDPSSFTTDAAPDIHGSWSPNFDLPPPDGDSGNGISGNVYSLCSVMDGNGPAVYAGGLFSGNDDNPGNSLARWNGSSWSRCDEAGSDGVYESAGELGYIYAITAFDPDGSGPRGSCLAIGGEFASAGGTDSGHAAWNVAFYDPADQTYHPIGDGLYGGPDFPGDVRALAVFDGVLYAAGEFDVDCGSGCVAHGIAMFDPNTSSPHWEPVGDGLGFAGANAGDPDQTGSVFALIVHDDGLGVHLYAGGSFDKSGGVTGLNGLAKWNGVAWEAVGSGVTLDSAGASAAIFSLASFDDDGDDVASLFVGGVFDHAGTVQAANIARWDGSSWTEVSGGVSGGSYYPPAVYSLAVLDGDGPSGPQARHLYAGGHFFFAGGRPVNHVARLDDDGWHALGGGVAPRPDDIDIAPHVYALAAADQGTDSHGVLYAGGNFAYATGTESVAIARWVPWCIGDYNHDGFVTGDDNDAFVVAFNAGDMSADANGDGFVTGDDFDLFTAAFNNGC